MKSIIFAFLLLTGCSPAYTIQPLSGDHPANPQAALLAYELPPNPLATDPVSPTPVSTVRAKRQSEEVREEKMTMGSNEATPLQRVLDAYLAMGDLLASDAAENVPLQARILLDALAVLEATPPADQPHFWHMRTADLTAIRTQAEVLTTTSDLAAARQAYGVLSDALTRIVAATGVPSVYDRPAYQFVCGMYKQAPQGGVWLQLGEEARNPYFGTKMLRCSTSKEQLPVLNVPRQDTHEHDGGRK